MATPKVLSLFKDQSFEDKFPDIPLLCKPTDLFIEGSCYNVYLHEEGEPVRRLDLFEEAVLRLINLNRFQVSAEEIADILCLDADLICFILSRLAEKGLLDAKKELTQQGRAQLGLIVKGTNTEDSHESFLSKDSDEIQEESGYSRLICGRVFVLSNGQILPYIWIDDFFTETPETITDQRIALKYGSAGRPKIVSGYRLTLSEKDIYQKAHLPDNKLWNIVSAFSSHEANSKRRRFKVCYGYGIESDFYETVYLHIKALIQKGNSDLILFSDGSVPNIEGMDVYMERYPAVIRQIRESAVKISLAEGSQESAVQYSVMSGMYQNIVYNYNKIKALLPQKPYEQATADERIEMDMNRRQIAVDCFHMLEQALFCYLKEHPLSEMMIDMLTGQSAEENRVTVQMIAEKLGIRYVKEASGLFSRMDGSRILSFFANNIAVMYVCLPLAVAGAQETAHNHIRTLINKNSDFLLFIMKLSRETAGLRHDTEASPDYSADTPDIKIRKTIGIVKVLLPHIYFEEGDKVQTDSKDVTQVRLLAQDSLTKVFGISFFRMMPAGMKNDWMRISPDKTGRSLPDMNEYAQILYRILQTTLAHANKAFISKFNLSKEEAIRQAERFYGNKLPKSFTSVTNSVFQSAVSGRASSLGAEALICAVNQELCQELIAAGFIQTVDKIICLRGHGNRNVALTEDEHSMGLLRDNVIELSKIIGK